MKKKKNIKSQISLSPCPHKTVLQHRKLKENNQTVKGILIMNYKPPFASENLVTDIKRIREVKNIKHIRVIHSMKTKDVTIVFECETVPGVLKELSFSPWNVKFRSNQFYLDNPILWFFDDKKDCHEDAVAFTLACMKALNENNADADYTMLMALSPVEIANEVMKVYPSTLIEY